MIVCACGVYVLSFTFLILFLHPLFSIVLLSFGSFSCYSSLVWVVLILTLTLFSGEIYDITLSCAVNSFFFNLADFDILNPFFVHFILFLLNFYFLPSVCFLLVDDRGFFCSRRRLSINY